MAQIVQPTPAALIIGVCWLLGAVAAVLLLFAVMSNKNVR